MEHKKRTRTWQKYSTELEIDWEELFVRFGVVNAWETIIPRRKDRVGWEESESSAFSVKDGPGGQSNAANILKDDSHQDYMKDAENAFAVGYGFSAFFHFCAFAVILGAAFHILPATGGSAKEAKCVQKPESLETN
eukprot:scaffold10764_cov159-Ochromonas_danica.AAC.35